MEIRTETFGVDVRSQEGLYIYIQSVSDTDVCTALQCRFPSVRHRTAPARAASTPADSSSFPDHFPSPASQPNSSFPARSPKTSNKVNLAGKLEFCGLAEDGKWSGKLLESAKVKTHPRSRRSSVSWRSTQKLRISGIAEDKNPVACLQSEYEKVQDELEKVKKKAQIIENKVKVRIYSYERRAKDVLWPTIEKKFKQIETATKELECFQALQKLEKSAATSRINNMWEEKFRTKRSSREQTLQKRYGDHVVKLEKFQHQSKGTVPIKIF
ncbi:hypothetical protein ACLB2K_023046 [Fragaria x ananassa]